MAAPKLPTLGDVAEDVATISEGMGALVAARRTLVEGGFSPRAAEAIVLQALTSATAVSS